MSEARSRGRPRTFDPDAILEGAAEEFRRHGYEGASIADLTQTLGCTAPTLYSLFGSKEGLFRQALDRYLERGFSRVADAMAEGTPLVDRLEAWLRATATQVTSDDHAKGCLVLTGGLTMGPAGAEAGAALRAAREAARAGLVTYLARARDEGELPVRTDVEGLARFYLAVVQGMSAQAIDGASRDQLEPLIASALAAWPGAVSPGTTDP